MASHGISTRVCDQCIGTRCPRVRPWSRFTAKRLLLLCVTAVVVYLGSELLSESARRKALVSSRGGRKLATSIDRNRPPDDNFVDIGDDKSLDAFGNLGMAPFRKSEEDLGKAMDPVFTKPGQKRSNPTAADRPRTLKILQHVATRRPNIAAVPPKRKQPSANTQRTSVNPAASTTQGAGVEPLALLILRPIPFFSISLADMREILTKHRIRFEVGLGSPKSKTFFPQGMLSMPGRLGRYSVIVFEDWSLYTRATEAKQRELDTFCLQYGVGVVAFVSPASHTSVFNGRIAVDSLAPAPASVALSVNAKSPVLRIVKDGGQLETLVGIEWCTFTGSNVFTPLEYSHAGGATQKRVMSLSDSQGQLDGVRRVLFCRPAAMHHWLHKALFMDAVNHLSPASLGLPLGRRFLMDIDDIFVAPNGTKMSPQDVEALLKTQQEVRKVVPNFTYNLGFVGSRFGNGTAWESAGDRHLVKLAKNFYWFPHTYTHRAPHKSNNVTELMMEMKANKHFAKAMGIPVSGLYAIAPKHSGIYPIHEPLYTAWREVWSVKSTSTEEYMHLKPAYKRRGFVYRGVKVMPRQTCGLFTHTFKKKEYPGGFSRLEENVLGGEMFQTILHNTISIFMTHVSNYGHDRLGNYVTEAVVKFIQQWTHLVLSYAPPHKIADEYFETHVEEIAPFWLDPCRDPRHYAIWSEENRRCYNLPHALIVGPQKTGTTAMLDFLTMHPSITRNRNTARHFEEMQFFSSDTNYNFGLDWYMQHMPIIYNKTNVAVTYNASDWIEKPQHLIIEKSATYFDSYLAPLRAWRLLPSVKIIVILTDPGKRAYSWWQHQVAHRDPATSRTTFKQLLARKHHRSQQKTNLKQRCLFPGQYATHLKRWMAFIPRKQIHIVDGDQLSRDPVPVMTAAQRFLNVTVLDYSKMIKKSEKKGFYCPVVHGVLRCLGKGKGRVYPGLDSTTKILLRNYFLPYNLQLAKLLTSLRVPFPAWLKEIVGKTLTKTKT